MRVLKGHGHWVNSLALSSEHALRTGAFDHHGSAAKDPAQARQAAEDRCAMLLSLRTGFAAAAHYLLSPAADRRILLSTCSRRDTFLLSSTSSGCGRPPPWCQSAACTAARFQPAAHIRHAGLITWDTIVLSLALLPSGRQPPQGGLRS